MGAPPENQGMPEDLRRQWKEYLEQEGDPAELAEARVSLSSYSPGKAGQQARQEDVDWWTKLFRDRDVDAVSRWLYPSNETPRERAQVVAPFQLNRWPTVNAWYRLFDPGHGLVDSWYRNTYRKISPDAETPTIFVSWYDAWAFCLWAHWHGESCRLPHEHQWEYAAKAGTDWSWNYWWGDEFDRAKCNADQNVDRTTRPASAHANPWSLEDILGNVWEWTDDEYRRVYALDEPPDSSARVLRGGSWYNDAFFVRSAYRLHDQPWLSEFFLGFRVARALPRKS
jgi:formylglycine-generating enzyme required for sulfatase activity